MSVPPKTMIRVRSNLKSSGSFLNHVVGSNILFCSLMVLASVGLFFGWRYLDQHRQVMKVAQAKADAIAAARPAVAVSTSAEPATVSAPISAPSVVNQPARVQNNASANEPAPTQFVATAEAAPTPRSTALANNTPQQTVESAPGFQTAPPMLAPELKAETHQTIALAPEKTAPVRLSDAIASVFTPSAKAMMIQPTAPLMAPSKHHATATATKSKPAAPTKPQTADEKRLQTATDGFEEVMGFAKNHRDIYGFKSSEDLEAAKLGAPIPICVLAQPSHASYGGQPVKSLLKPADEWFFPIVLNERVRYMVLVQRSGQEYVLGHGSRALAMAYEKIQARWPASEGYHPQLILFPNTPFYYFNIPELAFENITDTSRMLDSNPEISPAGVQLGGWR